MKANQQIIPGVSPAAMKSFFQNQPVRKAFLFGSYARKEARPDSDIDMVVELDYNVIKTGLEFFALWDGLEDLTGRKIDLITREGLSKYAVPDFERDKVLIYERHEA